MTATYGENTDAGVLLNVEIHETPTCVAVQSCRSPAACQWFFLLGWHAWPESVGKDAHLFGKMKENKLACPLKETLHYINFDDMMLRYLPSICFCSWGGAAASMEAVRGSWPWTCTAGWVWTQEEHRKERDCKFVPLTGTGTQQDDVISLFHILAVRQ